MQAATDSATLTAFATLAGAESFLIFVELTHATTLALAALILTTLALAALTLVVLTSLSWIVLIRIALIRIVLISHNCSPNNAERGRTVVRQCALAMLWRVKKANALLNDLASKHYISCMLMNGAFRSGGSGVRLEGLRQRRGRSGKHFWRRAHFSGGTILPCMYI